MKTSFNYGSWKNVAFVASTGGVFDSLGWKSIDRNGEGDRPEGDSEAGDELGVVVGEVKLQLSLLKAYLEVWDRQCDRYRACASTCDEFEMKSSCERFKNDVKAL